MPEFRVRWVIDIEADTPREAAEKARQVQQNPDSIATVFEVWPAGSAVMSGHPLELKNVDLNPEYSLAHD